MPRGDGTGPRGAGPMTGRRAGYCAGFSAPGFAYPGPAWQGGGFGARGGGRGWRNMYYATGLPGWQRFNYAPPAPTPRDEVEMLKAQSEWLKSQLDAIGKRIDELE